MMYIILGLFFVGGKAGRSRKERRVAVKHFLKPAILSMYETLK